VLNVIRRRIMNTVLLHTKKQQLMSMLADRFYRQEKIPSFWSISSATRWSATAARAART
jgi:hypothetical protein